MDLERITSGHRHIILRQKMVDYGHIPFNMFNSWLELEDFEQTVKQTWDTNRVVSHHKKFLVFKNKLKHQISRCDPLCLTSRD